MKALLTNYRQSPQKVRLVANLVRGKSVAFARQALTYQPQKSSEAVLKLLNSAVSNASNIGAGADDLFIKTIQVNKGSVLKRFAPRARGRAASFSKTMSIISIELGMLGAPKAAKVSKAKAVKSETVETDALAAPKTTKKTASKRASKKVVATTE